MGLTVNRYVDERKDFNKSAFAASELLKTFVFHKLEEFYNMDDIDPEGNELWFKILVLHIYHAGVKM